MRRFSAVVATTVAVTFAGLAWAEDELFKGQSVVNLNKDAFANGLDDKPHFIKFYAPWCGHCQRLAPTWEQLADKFTEKEKVVIAKVDCTEEPEVCTEHDIQGYPTLKFFKAGQLKDGEKYRGSRELDALNSWVLEKIGEKKPDKKTTEGLHDLTDQTFDKHIASGRHFIKFFAPWCGHCKNLAPTWEQLASKYASSGDVSIAKVDCTQYGEICKKFEVRGYPTLLFLQNGGDSVEKYQGSRALGDLASFVDKMVKTEPKKADKSGDNSDAVPILLTEENFDNEIGDGVTFVKFYAPWCGHCRNLAPTWTDLARKVPNAKIAKVDCTEHENLCTNNEVQGYPTLVIFKDGKRIEEYNGSRDLDDLKEFVDRHAGQPKDEL